MSALRTSEQRQAGAPADQTVFQPVILRIDPKERRISLGIRQTTDDPWSALPDRYPPGTPVKGKITGMTDFGVFMEIEEGIEGLIHISELDLNRVNNPADLFKKGDEIEAMILNIDPVEQRASLSRRRFLGGGPAPTQGGGNRDFVSQGGGARSDRYSSGGGQRASGGCDLQVSRLVWRRNDAVTEKLCPSGHPRRIRLRK